MAEQAGPTDAVVAYLHATWTDEDSGRQRHMAELREAFEQDPAHVVETYRGMVRSVVESADLDRRHFLWSELRLREAQLLVDAVPALKSRYEAELLRLMAKLHLRQRRPERGLPEMEAAMEAALRHDDFRTGGLIMEELAETALEHGEHVRAVQCNHLALQNFTLAGDETGATRCQERAARIQAG